LQENLIVVEEKTLVADEKFLTLVGFSETPRLYPDDVWKNTSLPVIVTVVSILFIFYCKPGMLL
jgi:hypothetical protein